MGKGFAGVAVVRPSVVGEAVSTAVGAVAGCQAVVVVVAGAVAVPVIVARARPERV